MISIGIDTSPLASGHAVRGIGAYTRFLTEALENLPEITLTRIATDKDKATAQIDLLHYPFFDLFFDSLPVVQRTKRVVTIHDVIPLKYPDHYPVGVKGKLRLKKQKVALKTVSAVITDSEASKLDIIELLGVPETKIKVVPLAANPEIQRTSEYLTTKIRREYKIPPNYLLYVGDINYNKNIPQLIKMMKYVPEDLHLVCVGRNFFPHDIPEWQAIDTQLEMSQVRNRVHFINNILGDGNQALSAIYTGALAYIQPSLYEGFGLPILEAMQAGTPVIAAETSSLIEVGGQQVLFANPDAESFAEQVEEILTWSPSKKSSWIAAATDWAQTFSWHRTALGTKSVYDQVLS